MYYTKYPTKNLHRWSDFKAFTLIELLVVIALIAVLAGGIGVAMRSGSSANALQAGQSSLSSLISGVRARAALANNNAILVVESDVTASKFNPDTFLRAFRIAYEDGSGNWVAVGDEVRLPRGIYLVPRNAAQFSSTIVNYGPNWNSTTYSGGFLGTNVTLTNVTGVYRKVIELDARGFRDTGGPDLILSPAERSQSSLTFDNSTAVRGAKVSTYGVLTFINDESAFN